MYYIRTLDVYLLSVSFNIPKCLVLPFIHLSNTFCFCFCSKPSGPQTSSFLFSFYCRFPSSTFYHSCSTFRFFSDSFCLWQEEDPNRSRKKPLGETNFFCPVALKETGILFPGNPEIAARYREKVFYMSSNEARDKFVANPQSYLPQDKPLEVRRSWQLEEIGWEDGWLGLAFLKTHPFT